MALLPPRRSHIAAAPAELGEAMDAEQIRTEFFHGRVSRAWVLEHVDPDHKWYMGKTAVWYRGHVEAWMPVYAQQQQARAQRRRRTTRGE